MIYIYLIWSCFLFIYILSQVSYFMYIFTQHLKSFMFMFARLKYFQQMTRRRSRESPRPLPPTPPWRKPRQTVKEEAVEELRWREPIPSRTLTNPMSPAGFFPPLRPMVIQFVWTPGFKTLNLNCLNCMNQFSLIIFAPPHCYTRHVFLFFFTKLPKCKLFVV